MNARQIRPLSRIPEEQIETARDLIYDRRREDYDPLIHFLSLFEDVESKPKPAEERAALPVEERLKHRIIDGDRRGLDADLDEALGEMEAAHDHQRAPAGRDEGGGRAVRVGQDAASLRAAERGDDEGGGEPPGAAHGPGRGVGQGAGIVLATVRGDVHDIGKNLVDIILSNNGYTVDNLGIKQPIATIIEKALEVEADAIGLSGLLVKSTVVMREDLEELNARGLSRFPVLLGGAALNRRYVEHDLRAVYEGDVYYCRDAFEGLDTLGRVVAGEAPAPARTARSEAPATRAEPNAAAPRGVRALSGGARCAGTAAAVLGEPGGAGHPAAGRVPVRERDRAPSGRSGGYQRGDRGEAEYEAFLEEEVRPVFRGWQERAIGEGLLTPQVVYGYYKCQAEGNDLLVWPEVEGEEAAGEPVRFAFPRQASGRRLCIADFFRDADSGEYDTVAFTLVTMGPRATELAQELFESNEYRDYLHFHGFGVESAEALAEFWHRRVRRELGIGGQDATEIRKLFGQGYQGSRYSFGYPACPDLEQQTGIAELLGPERVGGGAGGNVPVAPGADDERDRGAPPGGALLHGLASPPPPRQRPAPPRRRRGGFRASGGSRCRPSPVRRPR